MDALIPHLKALYSYAQFIVYKLTPRKNHPEKMDKIPIDYRTGHMAIHGIKSDSWTTAEDALRVSTQLGSSYGIGFVFTKEDPFWFLDIDDAKDTNTGMWKPQTLSLCEYFPQSYKEISSSTQGIHIIGQGIYPSHSCRNIALNIEFYTHDRFVALTAIGATGDVQTDTTHLMQSFIDTYFPPALTSLRVTASDCTLIASDQQLIEKACFSISARSAFGSAASFKDLWDANIQALQKAFPDLEQTHGYNASSADAALAQHLAFWTGNDRDRMFTLMQQSQLIREKWDRPDYLPRTIEAACSKQTVFYTENSAPAPSHIEKKHAFLEPTNPEGLSHNKWHRVQYQKASINIIPDPIFPIEHIFPCEEVTLLSGHGGSGKSLLMLQAAVCMSLGIPFMNKVTIQSKTLYYSAEDRDKTLQRRIGHIARYYNVSCEDLYHNIILYETKEHPALYQEFSSYLHSVTENYENLKLLLERYTPTTLMIDNSSNVFYGNENSRPQVSCFANALESLASQYNIAVVLLAHIDKASAKGQSTERYSGSTAWHNSARSRLSLIQNKELARLELHHDKSNFGDLSEPIFLSFSKQYKMFLNITPHIQIQDENTLRGMIIEIIDKYYNRKDFICPQQRSIEKNFKLLQLDSDFPIQIKTSTHLNAILQSADAAGLLIREDYKDENRKLRMRYRKYDTKSLD